MSEAQGPAPDVAVGQANVRVQTRISTITATTLALVAYHLIPVAHFKASLQTPVDRLIFTIQWNVLTVGVLFFTVIFVARLRFGSKQMNPLANEDRDKVEIHSRVLTNTVEQFITSFVAQLVASTWLEASQMTVIPIVVVLFVTGRILFWRGYLDPTNKRTNRARGLPLTFYPTALLLLYSIFKLFGSCCYSLA